MIDISKISGNQIDRSNIIHSSGIRRAANGAAFGATSSETFSARQSKESSRQHIGSYSTADVHSGHRARVRPFNSGARVDIAPGSRNGRSSPRSPLGSALGSPRHRFDPYSR